MTCVYNNSQEVQQYLASLQAKSTPYFIPALLMMSLSIPVGCVGNSLVFIVYLTKLTRTALRTFIICMSVFDILISICVVPGELYDLLHVWDFNRPLVCKFRRYFNCTLIIGSFQILVAIAITRYKMICYPPKRRVTITQAKVYCVIIALVSCTGAVPYFMINGSQKRRTPDPNICGYFCQVDDKYKQTIWPTVNSLLFIAIYITCTIVLVVSYICIGLKVWTHKVAGNKRTGTGQEKQGTFSENTSSVHENNRVMCQPGPAMSPPRDPSPQRERESTPDIAEVQCGSKVEDKNKFRLCHRRRSVFSKTSCMMAVISLVSIVGFVPLLALNQYKTLAPKSYASLEGLPLALYHLFFRSYLLNSAINPILFSVWDKRFRRECLKLFKNCNKN